MLISQHNWPVFLCLSPLFVYPVLQYFCLFLSSGLWLLGFAVLVKFFACIFWGVYK